jgi:hypothetical protein
MIFGAMGGGRDANQGMRWIGSKKHIPRNFPQIFTLSSGGGVFNLRHVAIFIKIPHHPCQFLRSIPNPIPLSGQNPRRLWAILRVFTDYVLK